MKRFLYLLCFFYALTSHAQRQLYPYSDGTKWGLTNEKLDVILAPQFERNPHIVKGNLAIVQKGTKFGLVNHKGKVILPLQYDEFIDLNGETGRVAVNGKYTFINFKSLRPISSYQFDEASDCDCPEKLMIVTKDGKTGFLNITTGVVVGGLIYDDVSLLKYYPRKGKSVRFPDLAVVKNGGKYGVLNVSTGTMTLDTKYDYIRGVMDEGRMLISADIGVDTKHFDLKGNEVYVQQLVVVAGENESYEPSTVSEKEEEEHETTIDLYAAGSIGHEGWTVTIERTRGDKTEVLESYFVDGYEIVGKLYYDSAEGASTARIKGVKTNPNISISVMDVKGNLLARYDYQNIVYEDGFYATWLNGKIGIVTMDLVEVKEPMLEYILDYDPDNPDINAAFIQLPNGQRGYMDKKSGKIFIPGLPQ